MDNLYHSDLDHMEMPTPCQKCGEWFDLHDGTGSEKWYPKTVICSDYGEKEQNIIEIETDIEDLQEEIDDANSSIVDANETISHNTAKIQELQDKLKLLEDE